MRPPHPSPQEIARALRRAAQTEPLHGQPWSVRIRTADATHDAELGSQAQVCRLTSDLERLGLRLEDDPVEDVDFVFAPDEPALESR